MLISEILKLYGDVYISEEILNMVGIALPKTIDMMLSYKQVKKLINGDPYSIIGKLKVLYGCQYEEMQIPLSILCQHYCLNQNEAYQKLQEE